MDRFFEADQPGDGRRRLLLIEPRDELINALWEARSGSECRKAILLPQHPGLEQFRHWMDTQPSPTVIIGLSEPEAALRLVRELHAAYQEIVIAAADADSPDMILSGIRAGACECLGRVSPAEMIGLLQGARRLDLNALVEVRDRGQLERALAAGADLIGVRFHNQNGESLPPRKTQAAGVGPKGRLIAFLPVQGGSGASTVATHVAAAISQAAEKAALLVDWDFHSGTLDFRLRLEPRYTLADAFERTDCLHEMWNRLTCRWKGADVLLPPRNHVFSPGDLSRSGALFTAARNAYDWVVVDLPPAAFSSCQDVLAQAETIYLVCTSEAASLHLAQRKAQDLQNCGIAPDAVRLVLNRVGRAPGSLSARDVAKIVRIPIACELPNDYSAANRASLQAELVSTHAELGRGLRTFARSITGVSSPLKKSALVGDRLKLFGGRVAATVAFHRERLNGVRWTLPRPLRWAFLKRSSRVTQSQ